MKDNVLADDVLSEVTGGTGKITSYASYFSVDVRQAAAYELFCFMAYDLPICSYTIECPNGDKLIHEEADYFHKIKSRGDGDYKITAALDDGTVICVIFNYPACTFVDA